MAATSRNNFGQKFADGVKLLHMSCVLFLFLGWALPKSALLAHLLFIPIVMLHWWTNGGQCVLTQLENRLRGKVPKTAQGQFVSGVFAKIGLQPTRMQLMIFIYGVMLVSGGISAWRLGYL